MGLLAKFGDIHAAGPDTRTLCQFEVLAARWMTFKGLEPVPRTESNGPLGDTHASPTPLPLRSSCAGFATRGQLSNGSAISSPSESAAVATTNPEASPGPTNT